MRYSKRKRQGFTLIELLVVVAIVGILASVILASLNTARDKARFGKIQTTMDTLNKVASLCMLSDSSLIIPTTGATGGSLVCNAETTRLPDISDTKFIYCGTGCGGWTNGNVNYAISVYSDSYSGGRKVVVCGSNYDASSWYFGDVPAGYLNFTGMLACKKYGF